MPSAVNQNALGKKKKNEKEKVATLVGLYTKKKKYHAAATKIVKMWRGWKWRSLLGKVIKRIKKRHDKWAKHKRYHKAATKIASEWRICVAQA